MKQCTKCKAKKPKSEFTKHSRSKDGLNCWCKLCSRKSSKSYMECNKEKESLRKKIYYEENKQELLQKRKEYQKDNEDYITYQSKYREDNKERSKKYRIGNKQYFAEKTARRRATKIQATPKWLSEEDLVFIKYLYEQSVIIFEQTGIKHNVDHIVPLIHPLVCGLHVPENLRIITEEENKKKNNKYIIS